MTHPLGLDEYTESDISLELRDRAAKRASGLCDYCGRTPQDPVCKYPGRHLADADADEEPDDD